MPASTTLRRALPLVLLALITITASAQHMAAARPGHGIVQGDRSAALHDTIVVPPGFSCVSTSYAWVDLPDGTGTTLETAAIDFANGVPVSWIDGSQGFTPTGGESFDCGTPFPISVPINAPADTGTYSAQLVDLAGFFDTLYVVLRVVDVPSHIDFLFQDTLLVDEVHNIVGTASGAGTDVACVPGDLPEDSISYNYAFYPPAAWISQTPMHLVVPAGVDSTVALTVQSAIPGDFVTYRYRSASWYTLPYIVEYQLHVDVGTGMAPNAEPSSTAGLMLYPNPSSTGRFALRSEQFGPGVEKATIDVTDTFGKRVKQQTVALSNGSLNTFLDLGTGAADGLYFVTIHAGERTFTQRVVMAR